MWQTILEFLFGWMPEATYAINISIVTPLDKAKAFLVCVIAGHLIYHLLLKPGVKIVWAIVAGLVCAVSLHALTIYAAYKFKRLNKLRWLMLVPYLLQRWLDFTFAGFKGTTIRSQYFIWSGPFSWTLVAQSFKVEPTVDAESDDDEWPDDEHPDDALLRKLHEPIKDKDK